MLKFRGIFCPLATPFDARGELYAAKVRHNTEKLNRTRLSGYLVGSHVGEGSLLNLDEKRRLWEQVREAAAEDRVLMAGVSAESVRGAAEAAREAARIGYSAAVSEAPLSYPQADAMLYFRALADQSPLPLVMEVSDLRNLALERIEALAVHPNIAAVYARDLAAGHGLLTAKPEGVELLSGSARSFTALWGSGVHAAVLPLANAIPFHLLSIEEALRTREAAAAEQLAAQAGKAFSMIWDRFGPAGLKFAMDLKGCYGGPPRLPLSGLSKENKREISESLDQISG